MAGHPVSKRRASRLPKEAEEPPGVQMYSMGAKEEMEGRRGWGPGGCTLHASEREGPKTID